jgi:predicted  nucleic acid-binding Zn-ribbon protein|tara:strand:+ start:4666 stop:5880 length:1215 start_codon:yes stop_codon:yes gene_type:complete
MSLNPFDAELDNAEKEASELRVKLEEARSDLDWYDRTDPKVLSKNIEDLHGKRKLQSKLCNELQAEVYSIEQMISSLSLSINSRLNPINWFDSDQRGKRRNSAAMKKMLADRKNEISRVEVELTKLKQKIVENVNDIKRHESYDYDEKISEFEGLKNNLSTKEKEIRKIYEKKEKVDSELAPVINQILDAEEKIRCASKIKNEAEYLDNDLSRAENSYERAMVHKSCEERFGVGNPKRVVSKKESEIRRLERDIAKLHKRAENISNVAARDVQKLILDGNNLCYQGGRFIGLSSLISLVPVLVSDYKVVVVFDSSIRRSLGVGDSEIRESIGSGVEVHVVATSVKADETVIDIAGRDETAFIVSNDRFSEFGEKPAVRDDRVIRHEIVSGKIFINDLGVSVSFS